ncbi:MAG: hypothetical protein EBW61_07570 [Rhodobacteraceae bacterium]|nr:hypothetical protein [Paracoccaceae bacterium]
MFQPAQMHNLRDLVLDQVFDGNIIIVLPEPEHIPRHTSYLHGKGHSKKRSIAQNRIFHNTPKRLNCALLNAPRCLNYGEIWNNLGRRSGFA